MRLFDTDPVDPKVAADDQAAGLSRAAAAFARLDQALAMHPLQTAFLYRFRLDAVRRQAAVDGQMIEPWHLAAVLEGLRLRLDPDVSILERGMIIEAARYALTQFQWISDPDFDQEGDIQRASAHLALARPEQAPLLAAAFGAHQWLDRGGQRAPLRGALVRYWRNKKLLHAPIPLTGPRALGADVPFKRALWVPLFLDAIAREAEDGLDLLRQLERAWLTARAAVVGRRSNSRATAAVDLLAAAPLISATTLASGLGMAIKNAIILLRDLERLGIVIDVSHRSKRRLFALAGLGQLRDHVTPPRRSQPGRGRGRPRLQPEITDAFPMPFLAPIVPGPILVRASFDYTDLDQAMANLDQVIRDTNRNLDRLRPARVRVAATD